MSQDDEGGRTPGWTEPGEAATQAMPHLPQATSTQGPGGSVFDRPTARPLGRQSRAAMDTAMDTAIDTAIDTATAASTSGAGGGDRKPIVPRPSVSRTDTRGAGRPAVRTRRAKLALRRIDPWSVFLFSLLASIFLGIVLVVAVTVLYAVLANLGVLDSINDLVGEVAGDGTGTDQATDLITSSRVISGAAVLAAVDIVLLTALATLGALLYNVCAALTGGIEVTLGERD